MPSLRIIIPVALLFSVAVFVGGYLLLRQPLPKANVPPPRGPQPQQPVEPDPPAPEGEPKADTQQPKLVVFVVFDQMRGDYLSRWAELYGPDGFNRFKTGGTWFSECRIPYACTTTGPGHASLATGAPPSVHGIVENVWYDRATEKLTYCCEPKDRAYDLIPPVPGELGKPGRGAANGFSPQRLLVPGVADSLQEATQGKGRVFSLSIKDRTAVLMGGRKPNAAYCFDTRDGKFHTGAYYDRDAPHPWVKELNDSKLVDSWFETKWEKLRPDLDYAQFSGPDDALGEADGINGQGRTFPHPYRGRLDAPARPYYAAVEASPAGNELLFELAKKCVAAEKLGRGASPDLLCVSFSSNDIIGHLYGPDSQEVLDATLRADKLVGEFLQFLDAEVGKGQYVMVISADHGACPLPELPSTKAKYPAASRHYSSEILNDLGKYLDGIYGGQTQWLELGGDDADAVWPWVYLNHKAIEARKLKVEDVAAAARDRLTAGHGFIETAFTRKELEDGNFPPDQPFKKMAALAYHPDRCGDVIVVPKPGVYVTSEGYKTGTGHGSPHPYDTHIPFLTYGAGVPALGERKEPVSSLSVAPTLSWALGVSPPKHNATILRPEAIK